MSERRFNFEAWKNGPDGERHGLCALKLIEAAPPGTDDLDLMQDLVCLGLPRYIAVRFFHAYTGRLPPAVCIYCGHRFLPTSEAKIDNRHCDACGYLGPLAVKSEAARKRESARSTANMAVKRGKMLRQPCSVCGEKTAEKHHHDYSKPLDITWLCRACHAAEHARLKLSHGKH